MKSRQRLIFDPTLPRSVTAVAGRRLTRSDHDKILSALPRPKFFKRNGSLLDDFWIVETEDPQARMHTEYRFNFAVPINPGPQLLSDEENIGDLITSKLYVYYGLSDGEEGWCTSAHSMKRSFFALLDVIRWRLAEGLPRMADLSQRWFNLFVEHLAARGGRGLLPFEERIDQYIAEIDGGLATLPIVGKRMESNKIARRLGVSDRSEIPTEQWGRILALLKKTEPVAFRYSTRALKEGGQESTSQMTSVRASRMLEPFDRLWRLRDRLAHDAIRFNAFDHISTRSRLAMTIATRPLERTQVPPDLQVCWLVDVALRLVLVCGPVLRKIRSLVEDGFRRYPHKKKTSGRRSINNARRLFFDTHLPPLLNEVVSALPVPPSGAGLSSSYSGGRWSAAGIPVRELLFVLLPAACAVVIATFSARRGGEITSLRDDCVTDDPHGDPWISVWIEKTRRKFEKIPVPASIVSAIEVLKWLSQDARESKGKKFLFLFKNAGAHGRSVRFSINDALRSLSDFAAVPLLPDETVWVWRSHQFRAFFSIVYFYRFDHPSLTALSFFLFHMDPGMTTIYVTAIVQGKYVALRADVDALKKGPARAAGERHDDERQALFTSLERRDDFEEVRQRFLMDIARGVATGKAPIGGRRGDIWARELEIVVGELDFDIQLVASSPANEATFDRKLRSWVEGKTIDPHPAGHGYCGCGEDPTDLAAAACLAAKRAREGGGEDRSPSLQPDYAYAPDTVCAGCIWNIQRRANTAYWEKAHSEALVIAERGATELARLSAGGRAREIEGFMERCSCHGRRVQ